MAMKTGTRRTAGMLAVALSLAGAAGAFAQAPYVEPAHDEFYDDFSSGIVDPAKWYAANKNWGGDITLDGLGQNYNGGVVPANLYVRDGVLQCEAHGSLYGGDVLGITTGGTPRPDQSLLNRSLV